MVNPVFGRPDMPCDPKHELLAVVMVTDGVATPVDCVALADLKMNDAERAAERLIKAFTRALNRMDVTYNPAESGKMAGWTISAKGNDRKMHTLEFIRDGFGQERVREVLLSRAREHSHHNLKLATGPDYWSFCIRALRPY